MEHIKQWNLSVVPLFIKWRFFMRKIKVLHIAEAAGGVEKYLENLFKYSNNDVKNYLIYSQNYHSKILINSDDSYEINMAHGIDLIKDIKSIRLIKNIINVIKPNIIYAHSSKAGALARLANINKKYILIYNPHGWSFNEIPRNIRGRIKNFSFKSIERFETPFTDKIICISDFEKNTAIKNRIAPEKKLKVIYSGIDLSLNYKKNNISRDKLNIPTNAFLVGMVARITETKAPDIFVKAAKIIKERIPNAYFIMIGDGNLKSQIISLIQKYNLSACFKITGWVDNPIEYIKLLDVGLLLSRWEGFGLVLPEYMNSGIPIVATRVGGIPDVIKNQFNGILVPPDDPIRTANAVAIFYTDSSLRRKMIINGKNIVRKRFNVEQEINNTLALYKEFWKE